MKLYSLLVSGLTAESNRVRYRDVLTAYREGKVSEVKWERQINPNFLEHSNCPTLKTDNNIEEWVCENEACVAVCKTNSSPMPNGNNFNGSTRLRCKKPKAQKGETEPYWNKLPPVCQTCDPDGDRNADPDITDSTIDAVCNIGLKNMKECYMSCTNGGKIGGKKKVTAKCFCDKPNPDNGCYWKSNREEIDMAALKCSKPSKPPTTSKPNSCQTKDPACTTLSEGAITYSNSWTCRNCFRIRANYRFPAEGITNWEDKDYVDIDFRYKVSWISFGHPIDKVEHQGKNRWRLFFKKVQ